MCVPSCALCVLYADASRLGSQAISSISIRVAMNTLSPTYCGRLLLSGGQQTDMKPSFTSCFPARHQETLYRYINLHGMVSFDVCYAFQNAPTLSALSFPISISGASYIIHC
ncbi:hypothetical protein P692DRAFT_20567605 [Suillus brevipes Sb2]|nr:hypothetical protein P692DRAFT_20567605 [Suillus brevipes Sb2]